MATVDGLQIASFSNFLVWSMAVILDHGTIREALTEDGHHTQPSGDESGCTRRRPSDKATSIGTWRGYRDNVWSSPIVPGERVLGPDSIQTKLPRWPYGRDMAGGSLF